jgi:hypothetical protein
MATKIYDSSKLESFPPISFSPKDVLLYFYLGNTNSKNYEQLIDDFKLVVEHNKVGHVPLNLNAIDRGKIFERNFFITLQDTFNKGVLLYPHIKRDDAELIVSTYLVQDIFKEGQFNVIFPKKELERNKGTLIRNYPDIAEKVAVFG